ncbi:centriolin isoform 1 [Planoprotostelium fungivorum]|uniref:Centriolin isoform 1 n=1 Tax=Planoprotostelium fungivorum TaxID=1890364 RepID=A0A2P6NT35_9EUKA|nr:centriolin isoform 1 [Planoprotostelium fungivorum]
MNGATNGVLLHLTVAGGTRTIDREEATSLWKMGRLVALFNIPFDNEQLFLSCQDFAIQDDVGKKDDVSNLRDVNSKMILRLREMKKELSSMQERLIAKEAENQRLSCEIAIQTDKHDKKLNELTKQLSTYEERAAAALSQMKRLQEEELQNWEMTMDRKLDQQKNTLQTELSKERTSWFEESRREMSFKDEEIEHQRHLVQELVKQNKHLSQQLREVWIRVLSSTHLIQIRLSRDESMKMVDDLKMKLAARYPYRPAADPLLRAFDQFPTELEFKRDHPLSARLQEDMFKEDDW